MNQEQSEGLPNATAIAEDDRVSLIKLLCAPRCLFAALAGTLQYFGYCYMEPILASRLKQFDLDTMQIALFFTIFAITYIIATVLVQFLPT